MCLLALLQVIVQPTGAFIMMCDGPAGGEGHCFVARKVRMSIRRCAPLRVYNTLVLASLARKTCRAAEIEPVVMR